MPADRDLIILGGGCAGLSLAKRLAVQKNASPRTLVLEARAEYSNDRTWCFWDTCKTPSETLVEHTWQSMSVQAGDRLVTIDCGPTPYQMISGARFYEDAVRTIQASTHVELMLSSSVLSEPARVGREWQVETNSGMFRSPLVVDTRPSRLPKFGDALLWQSFSGAEIECEKPVFDPARVDLMDFSDRFLSRIHFDYVLPASRHRALVEATVFGPHPLDEHDLAADLEHAIARRVGGASYRILRSENGQVPMGLNAAANPHSASDPTYVRAGLNAGAARPSNGYAFQRIQRWADHCAARLAAGKAPARHSPDPPILRALDHLFLCVLRSQPDAAPHMFLSLFEKASPERIIRFMSDRGTLLDYAAIIASLPIAPFVRELPQAFLHRPTTRKRQAHQ